MNDSVRLGLVRMEAETIFSLPPSVPYNENSAPCDLQTSVQDIQAQVPAECNHIKQITATYHVPATKPFQHHNQSLPLNSHCLWASFRQSISWLNMPRNVEGLGCLSPPVHFAVKLPNACPNVHQPHSSGQKSCRKEPLNKCKKDPH